MTENKMDNPIYAERFFKGLKDGHLTITKEASQEITYLMKYKPCNCLNKCEDCLEPDTNICYVQKSLVSMLHERG